MLMDQPTGWQDSCFHICRNGLIQEHIQNWELFHVVSIVFSHEPSEKAPEILQLFPFSPGDFWAQRRSEWGPWIACGRWMAICFSWNVWTTSTHPHNNIHTVYMYTFPYVWRTCTVHVYIYTYIYLFIYLSIYVFQYLYYSHNAQVKKSCDAWLTFPWPASGLPVEGCFNMFYCYGFTMIYLNWLVVSTPLKNISHLGWLFPIYGKIKCMFQTTNQ